MDAKRIVVREIPVDGTTMPGIDATCRVPWPGRASLRLVRIDVVTIFPGIFESPLRESLLGRAIEAGLVDVRVHDLRDSTSDKHRQVDDESYGGGPGMVMKPEPVFAAVEALGAGAPTNALAVTRRTEAGPGLVRELAAEPWLVLICGRYEGVDERVVEGPALPRRSRSATTSSRAGRSRPWWCSRR